MPARQRILVVSTMADDAELRALKGDAGRDPVVLTAPTADAKRVVRALGVEPQVELLLAPVSFPAADRGHQLDTLVREHALKDRFRDVVVITDLATSTLLLRTLAPDQLASKGAVTVVGLPRADRRIVARRAVVGGVVLGVVAVAAEQLAQILTLPAAAALIGLVLLLVPSRRHVGREILLAAATGLGVVLIVVASSQRFPA